MRRRDAVLSSTRGQKRARRAADEERPVVHAFIGHAPAEEAVATMRFLVQHLCTHDEEGRATGGLVPYTLTLNDMHLGVRALEDVCLEVCARNEWRGAGRYRVNMTLERVRAAARAAGARRLAATLGLEQPLEDDATRGTCPRCEHFYVAYSERGDALSACTCHEL